MKYLPLIIFFIFSCASKKDILFIQDSDSSIEYSIKYEDIKIKPDDILRIRVSSRSPELDEIFRFNLNKNLNSLEAFQIDGFLVDSAGYVKIPPLQSVYVNGLTITQASNLIEKILIDNGLLLNSTVDVKIINYYFTILGEVKNPGRYHFLENNMDIFQALGIAGDLTINGKRDDIKIVRKTNDIVKVSSLDITSSNLLNSQNFQIFPRDVIIVNANNARVKNAGIIGNFGNLLTVLSFILSSIILISNN